MSGLKSIEPDELGLIAALLGVAPARSLSTDELNVLGNFLVAIGSIMLTIAAQEQFTKEQAAPKEEDTGKNVQQQIRSCENSFNNLLTGKTVNKQGHFFAGASWYAIITPKLKPNFLKPKLAAAHAQKCRNVPGI